MERFSDLCQKDVVNICDGQCLGRVSDLALDWCNGTIEGLHCTVFGEKRAVSPQRGIVRAAVLHHPCGA